MLRSGFQARGVITAHRGSALRSYPAWAAACAVAMAVGCPIIGAAHEFGTDPSTPMWLRPVRILGFVVASLAMGGLQLVVLGRRVQPPRTWLALSVLGWTGAVFGSRIATIGLPGSTPVEWVADFVGILGGGFLGLVQLPALAVDSRAAFLWLASSTLAGPALIGGFLLAERWDSGEILTAALGGLTYGLMSGVGLRFLRRPQQADSGTYLTRHPA
jgi:hypothetical protein